MAVLLHRDSNSGICAQPGLRHPRNSLRLRAQGRTKELQDAYGRLVDERIRREKLEVQLRQSQKMEALGRLTAGIAHDFNNLLAVIIGNAELALDESGHGKEAVENIEQIMTAAKRARDLVGQILAFSRNREIKRNSIMVTPIIKEAAKLLGSTLPHNIRIDVRVETKKDIVAADPLDIHRLAMNLATNAVHAMRENGGDLTMEIGAVTFGGGALPDDEIQPGTYVRLTVRDTGSGMKEESAARIFEPFFTTKPVGQGTGIGLAVVYGIVKSHGGAVTVESRPDAGTAFHVFLPCAGTELNEQQQESSDEVRSSMAPPVW